MSQISLLDGTPVPFPIESSNWSHGMLTPRLIVLHHSGGHKAGDLPTLLGRTGREVSAHFYIDRAGHIQQLVQFDHIAWHAGISWWNGHRNVNNIALGIEQENLGDDGAWPDVQVQACAALCSALLAKFPTITREAIVGHKDVACFGFDHAGNPIWIEHGGRRKNDPFEYPWTKFAEYLQN